MTPVHVVLLNVPHSPDESPRERMSKQRDYARRALRQCAELSGAPRNGWAQEEGGRPIPNGVFYWSLSHTRGLAAAAIATEPVGIDVERIRPRRQDIFTQVGNEEEWKLLGGQDWPAFFRLWTAKEAVLKANGFGIGYLLDCLAIACDAPMRLSLMFRGKPWHVEQLALEHDLLVAVAIQSQRSIVWHTCDAQ